MERKQVRTPTEALEHAICPVKPSARSWVWFWPRPANGLPDNSPEKFEEQNETVMVSIR